MRQNMATWTRTSAQETADNNYTHKVKVAWKEKKQ